MSEPEEKISPVGSMIFGVVVTVALSAISIPLLPLVGRESGLWGVLTTLPLLAIVGLAVGLAFWSVNVGEWSSFRSPRLRFLVVVGLPLVLLGVSMFDLAVVAAGLILLLASWSRLSNPNGFVRGVRLSWPVLLVALALAIVAVVGWVMFGNRPDSGLDENGCVIGEQLWCKTNSICYEPWVGFCASGVDADSFNILKKIRSFSGLEMSSPLQDEFAWFEADGDNVVQVNVNGMTTRIENSDISVLERALIKADLEPDMVNTNRIGTGGIRGYRMLFTLVCSMTFSEALEGEGIDIILSCGRLSK